MGSPNLFERNDKCNDSKLDIVANEQPLMSILSNWCKHLSFSFADMFFWEACAKNNNR